MARIYKILTFVSILAIALLFTDWWQRQKLHEFAHRTLKFQLLKEIQAHDPHAELRKKLLKTVFANVDVTNPEFIFMKSSIKDISLDSASLSARFSSPQTGFKCLSLELKRESKGWQLVSTQKEMFDSKGSCFDNLELILSSLTNLLPERVTTDDLTIEREHWVSPTRLRLEGYIAKKSIYQYSLVLYRNNFEWAVQDAALKRLSN